MDVFEAIEKRHSYRGSFHDRPVSRADLKRIVEAGLKAPSGKNAQTTTFVIVDDPGLVRQIAELPGANKAQAEAKAFIACVLDEQPEAVYEGHDFQIEDCAAAVENILLAVTALGCATVWIDGWLRVQGRAATVGRMLGLPDGKVIRVILPIGVPREEWPRREKKPFEERAWFNRYGDTSA
jgi:nitroreductase